MFLFIVSPYFVTARNIHWMVIPFSFHFAPICRYPFPSLTNVLHASIIKEENRKNAIAPQLKNVSMCPFYWVFGHFGCPVQTLLVVTCVCWVIQSSLLYCATWFHGYSFRLGLLCHFALLYFVLLSQLLLLFSVGSAFWASGWGWSVILLYFILFCYHNCFFCLRLVLHFPQPFQLF